MNAVLDNDIISKGACYRLLPQLTSAVCPVEQIGVLGAARFVVTKKIKKRAINGDKTTVLEGLSEFFDTVQELEPSSDEQQLAAGLENAAQKANLNLDAGESQLCAIIVIRVIPILLTGDKRAIESIERLIDFVPALAPICGRIRCLEQIIAELLGLHEAVGLRDAVCSEPDVDKALSICFSCSSPEVPSSAHREALHSYIRSLKAKAPRALGS
jgi:hypothetical protein